MMLLVYRRISFKKEWALAAPSFPHQLLTQYLLGAVILNPGAQDPELVMSWV